MVKLPHHRPESPWSDGHSGGAVPKKMVVLLPVKCYRYTACGAGTEIVSVAVRLLLTQALKPVRPRVPSRADGPSDPKIRLAFWRPGGVAENGMGLLSELPLSV